MDFGDVFGVDGWGVSGGEDGFGVLSGEDFVGVGGVGLEE